MMPRVNRQRRLKLSKTKKYAKAVLTVVLALIASLTTMAAAPKSFTGALSDSMCGAKHMMPGKTDAECTRECVKANSKYALVVDKKVYTLSGPQDEFSRLAGKRVRVTGEQSGDTIAVKSITPAEK